MDQSASAQMLNPSTETLGARLYPTILFPQLVTASGKLEVIKHRNPDAARYKPQPVSLDALTFLSIGLPIVQASDIQVVDKLYYQTVHKVEWSRWIYVFKNPF